MPALLLQKPNKSSKAKDPVVALERRLELWENGNIIKLLNKGESIQERLPTGGRYRKNSLMVNLKFIWYSFLTFSQINTRLYQKTLQKENKF